VVRTLKPAGSWKDRLREKQRLRAEALANAEATGNTHEGGAASAPVKISARDRARMQAPFNKDPVAVKAPAGVRVVAHPWAGVTITGAYLLPACVCGEVTGATVWEPAERGRLCMHQCICGIKRQAVRMTAAELESWYIEQYQTYRRDTGQAADKDLRVANSRLDHYGNLMKGRTLDIGTARGAFVEAARARGIDAWGQDISQDSLGEFVYAGKLEEIHFPTDHFQTVTMHDVLEHVLDPWAFLNETYRLTDQEGRLIIDFPDFEAAEGNHHWKPVEHLWMFTHDQLRDLCGKIGFHYIGTTRPLPGRYMMHLRKPQEKRVSFLVAPGIGDSYWALGKLPAICKAHNLGMPDIYVSDMGDKQRSLPCVQKVSAVHGAGYRRGHHASPVWNEAYMLNGRNIFENHCGCDYFIAANGGLRHGLSMDEILPQYEMDWYLPLFRSKEEDAMTAYAKQHWGRYVVAYFISAGMYKHWIQAFGVRDIVRTLKRIADELKVKIVFTGAAWDKVSGFPQMILREAKDERFVDWVGETNFDQLLGLYRGAVGAIGYPSGSTIMANVLKVPLLLYWHKYFVEKFWRNCCTPESLGHWYEMADATTDNWLAVSKRFTDMVRRSGR
jgi:2-polyprenyl-3-methyl-5-hydroxy-6-metoxy-1,4-benzoquinol methylase